MRRLFKGELRGTLLPKPFIRASHDDACESPNWSDMKTVGNSSTSVAKERRGG